MSRKLFVDYIKAIGIILVIAGHVNFANSSIKMWIYAFHMPLFFFATGLVMHRQKFEKRYVEKKFSGLIIPYFLWAAVYAGFSIKNIAMICYGSYTTIIGSGALSSLWFLPAMFFAAVMAQIVINLFQGKKLLIGIMMILMIITSKMLPQLNRGYPWCVNSALMGGGFILYGYLFENFINSKSINIYWMLGLGGLLVSLIAIFNTSLEYGYVQMANGEYGNLILFVLAAQGGCIFAYSMAQLISSYFGNLRFLNFIGTNTLVIFAVHKPIISLFEKIFEQIQINLLIELTITVILTVIISCICCVPINKYMGCLAGKKVH